MKKIILLFTFFAFSSQVFAQNADINLLKNINVNRNRSLDPTFKFISDSVSPSVEVTRISFNTRFGTSILQIKKKPPTKFLAGGFFF